MIFASELKPGYVIKYNGQLHTIQKYKYNWSGRNEATVTLKMKNIENGSTVDTSMKGGEKLEDVVLDQREMNYIYKNGDYYALMDNETYEQIEVHIDDLGDIVNFLAEEGTVFVSFYEERPVSFSLPKNVTLTVEYTEPGEKGDSTGNPLKPAKLNTGAEVNVPLFVNMGDKIVIDTSNGEYLSRA
ncbi:elongation factor P [Oceanotoga sp. DSM 15011]|uniref:elongation factor P n=1 Tax=Oceanotoga sp. DSM 15011 TaxID=2984951 RepID=UPI0021F43244|nr:elongation factor P [Oceanotoga sp. DSM 15011]UYP00924.1 elongation factor P [Oceanotoga sp. DSM 15011]